ncbi:type II toxin-antitoxin system antitoxin [Flavitalea sp.]|nr:Arc family DNA-binding protein [Flavitalea sp.]
MTEYHNKKSKNIVSDKKSFVLRMDDEVYKALEKWAADEFRSVNGQLEYIIDKALKESGRKKSVDKQKKS